ncbi:MAG: cytochrome b [Proteobacteria bacterium]|nr:cytochrome b [Pseudomonadota bacterium]
MTGPAAQRYSFGAIILHWLIALLIALNYAAAWVAEDMPKPQAAQVMGNHKAIGLIVLALTVARIGWRLAHTPPPLSESLKAWEVALAKVVHALFYLLMLAVPLTGWAMHSAHSGGKAVGIFGLFAVPGLPLAESKPLAETFEAMHGTLTTLMLVLAVLHVAGALKHQFLDRDRSLQRILPWG